jgi:hypothetical protein
MGATREKVPAIRFKAGLFQIGPYMILRLPKSASAALPSRGMVMVEGAVNGFPFRSPLEPDGMGSHWLAVDKGLLEGAGAKAGDSVAVSMESTKQWPEPVVPADLGAALAADSKANALWSDITPMARWDWLRWIASTGRAETRQKRIGVALSKLKAGTRRPCCFNRALCTVPAVSKSGVLLSPAEAPE